MAFQSSGIPRRSQKCQAGENTQGAIRLYPAHSKSAHEYNVTADFAGGYMVTGGELIKVAAEFLAVTMLTLLADRYLSNKAAICTLLVCAAILCWLNWGWLKEQAHGAQEHRAAIIIVCILVFAAVGALIGVMLTRPKAEQSQQSPTNSEIEKAPPISTTSSFSTIVPVATVPPPGRRPVRRIPFDANINDPKADFYQDLNTLSQHPFENPPGITFQEKPLGDANVARIFLAQLVQYYILRRIRELQRGTLAFRVTKYLGKETAEAKAIDIPPVSVPDPVPYSIENLFRVLEGNEFLNMYSYSRSTKDGVETPHWDQLERTFWQNQQHPFVAPRGTVISLSGNDNDPERDVRLERPGFYKLRFSVVPLFGGHESLPENFYSSDPGVDSYSCRITMDYEIQQRTDGGFAPNLYVQWAEDLFAGMKKAMAP
jgi:hypothetical protein